MFAAVKAEFRKLLTVRSTYFIVLISLAIVALFAGYGDGFRADPQHLHSPGFLATESGNAIIFDGIILALAGLLLLAHEYRYNGILYTITSSNSRTKSLFAKVFTVTVYAVLLSLIVTFFSPLCSIIGTHLAHKHMVAQTYHTWNILLRGLFVGWGYAMYAFIITAIVRSQVGSIVTFLLIPLIGENIITGILKTSGKYLPFNSLQSVASTEIQKAAGNVSTLHAVVTAGIYIAVGLAVSSVLFARRDAN